VVKRFRDGRWEERGRDDGDQEAVEGAEAALLHADAGE
jgi:hypothetical protein